MFRVLEMFGMALVVAVFCFAVYKAVESVRNYGPNSPVVKAKDINSINAEIVSLKHELENAQKQLSEGISDAKDKIELYQSQLEAAEALKQKLS